MLVYIASVFLGLVQMRPPLLPVVGDLSELKFVSDSFAFNEPVFSCDIGVDDCFVLHVLSVEHVAVGFVEVSDVLVV